MPTVLFLNNTAITGVSGILKMFVRNKYTGASIEVNCHSHALFIYMQQIISLVT